MYLWLNNNIFQNKGLSVSLGDLREHFMYEDLKYCRRITENGIATKPIPSHWKSLDKNSKYLFENLNPFPMHQRQKNGCKRTEFINQIRYIIVQFYPL